MGVLELLKAVNFGQRVAEDINKDNFGTLMHLVRSGEVQEAGTLVTLS